MADYKDKVFGIADQLKAQGKNVSTFKVRQLLGGGCPDAIGRLINKWTEARKLEQLLTDLNNRIDQLEKENQKLEEQLIVKEKPVIKQQQINGSQLIDKEELFDRVDGLEAKLGRMEQICKAMRRELTPLLCEIQGDS